MRAVSACTVSAWERIGWLTSAGIFTEGKAPAAMGTGSRMCAPPASIESDLIPGSMSGGMGISAQPRRPWVTTGYARPSSATVSVIGSRASSHTASV